MSEYSAPVTVSMSIRESDRQMAAAAAAAAFERAPRMHRLHVAVSLPVSLLLWGTTFGVAGAIAWTLVR